MRKITWNFLNIFIPWIFKTSKNSNLFYQFWIFYKRPKNDEERLENENTSHYSKQMC